MSVISLDPGPGEPAATSWRAIPFERWLATLTSTTPVGARPAVIGIDGRGGSGKSTLADRIRDALPGSWIVRTDDLAWHRSPIDWADVLIEQVLQPAHDAKAVAFRPPEWVQHGRPGAITVPAGVGTLIVEGTGAIRAETIAWFDATAWVQADYGRARDRVIARDAATGVNGDLAAATAFWSDWQRDEVPFLTHEQPWLAADTVIAGEPVIPLRPYEIAVGTLRASPHRASQR